MGLTRSGSLSRRLFNAKTTTAAVAVGGVFALSAFVADASLSAYRALFETRVQISIASNLKLSGQNFSVDQDVAVLNQAPRVAAIKVRSPNLSVQILAQAQEFEILSDLSQISAVHKNSSNEKTAERKVYETLYQRLNGNRDQRRVENIKEVTPVVLDDQGEDQLDNEALRSVINGTFEQVVAKVTPKLRLRRHHVATQPIVEPVSVDTQVPVAEVPVVKEEIKPTQTAVAWDEIQGADRLAYSDIVEIFLKQKSNDVGAAVQLAPQENESVTTQAAAVVKPEPEPIDIAPVQEAPQAIAETAPAPVVVAPPVTIQNIVVPAPVVQQPVVSNQIPVTTQPTPVKPTVTVNATVAPATHYSGQVTEAFTGATRAVVGATIQILGTPWNAISDESGNFIFGENVKVQGVLPVIVTKDGYLKRRFDLRQNRPGEIELVSENSARLSSVAAGESPSHQGSLVFGQLVGLGRESSEAMKVEVNGPSLVTPVYLDENGAPNRDLRMTSKRGQFLLLNLRVGTYLINVVDAVGRERAPHIVHVGEDEGIVRKFSLGEEKLIRGRIFNASVSGAAVDQATVKLLGSQQAATTTAAGEFALGPIYVDCADLNYLQIDKNGFYRNRVDYACDSGSTDNHKIYTFSASYVDSIANEAGVAMKANSGAIVGHTNFAASVKMQLWGPEETNPGDSGRGKDFYIDTDGVLNPDLNRTTKNGNFTILDAPEGLSYIQAFDKNNQTLSFWPIFISPSTVNVYIQ